MNLTYEQLKIELKDQSYLNSDIQNKAYTLLDDMINRTSEKLITKSMQDLIVNCFAIISVYDFNNRDFNTIKSELNKAGWKI